MDDASLITDDGLNCLLPQVAGWFRSAFGSPTPPQRLGWPAVARGENTLIFAPTGSGKTLAAFLACLDHLWRRPRTAPGVRVLYLSPLKALNADIHRNLQEPLDGIVEYARVMGQPLARLDVAVRTGDTPARERQRMVRKPPEILISTPESLHLLLTSRARVGLAAITHVIVDEIHAVCSNKRGVFLSILLERLEELTPQPFVRIGLSATQRPLEEVARYLGGQTSPTGKRKSTPRPVTIVDAGGRKTFDLEVSSPFDRGVHLGQGAVWPAIEARVVALIRAHRSTIVFTNNRRVTERLTAHINELVDVDESEADDDAPRPAFARSHHGSIHLEERRQTEDALKRGELAAVVSTASLEMGIDMGAVDLVCQVESPGSVSRGLQRVGRAGHVVGRTSKGRLIAKSPGDLLETAALCRAMIAGDVEILRVPTNCLDILAQQVVACVAVGPCDVAALYSMIRRSYPYRDLSAEAFEGVLLMVSGRFPTGGYNDLKPRVSWDRVQNRLMPLPGTSRLALSGGGAIPDTGQYPVYLGADGPKLGELDEEFVLERRKGDTFVFGTATWRIESIEPLKVVVGRAEGSSALMPFWRGESAARTPELGDAVGKLTREISSRIDDPTLDAWLEAECRLDAPAARTLHDFVARQLRRSGVAPDDRTILVESFRDPAGELGLAVLTPFGGKLHQGLKLAIQARLRERLGLAVTCLHGDEGLILRLPGGEDLPLDLFDGLTSASVEPLIRSELGESALFGLRFRQNAGRALLLPRPDPTKRAPLWLQRLRAKDLLQVVRPIADFPIVIETYRECLSDDLDLDRLRRFLDDVAAGAIRVVRRAGDEPSPFVGELTLKFMQSFLYEWDEPRRADRAPVGVSESKLLDALIDPGAIARVDARLRGSGRPPRTIDEMAERLRELGDLAPGEAEGPMLGFLEELQGQGRAVVLTLQTRLDPQRWVDVEEVASYSAAFAERPDAAAAESIVRRFLRTRALVGIDELTARYPIGPARATEWLERWVDEGTVVRLDDAAGVRWGEPRHLDEARRITVALRRSECVTVPPEVFADFLLRRHGLHAATRLEGRVALEMVVDDLRGFAAPLEIWEQEILPRRIKDFQPRWLDDLFGSGRWTWRAFADGRGEPDVAIVPRDFPGRWPAPSVAEPSDPDEALVLGLLESRGASFATDLSRSAGIEPSRIFRALDALAKAGVATNDRLDPLRPAWRSRFEALAALPRHARSGRPRHGPRRSVATEPDGRWSRLTRIEGDPESSVAAWVDALLTRHGVLARETAALDAWAPPWSELAPYLARAELRGEVRRGYFVEGLSGVQYALEEVADELARLAGLGRADAATTWVATLDPANLYGSGAPLDVALLEGGAARLPRNAGNSVVLVAGRPVLIVEGHGKRLTGLASASDLEIQAALALLPGLSGPTRRILKVETYNTAPALASPAAPWLIDVGFVRDPPGLAFYAAW